MKAYKKHRLHLFGLLMGKISKMAMNDVKKIEEELLKLPAGSAVAEAIRKRFNLNGQQRANIDGILNECRA